MAGKKKNTGLGKGLDALFGEMNAETLKQSKRGGSAKIDQPGTTDISIDDIKPNANQPRKVFDEEGLTDLAESIKEHGIIQPIIVRPSNGIYEIVAGERRWRASRLAGLKEVPCLVRELSDEELMLLAIVENMQREDLNPIEEAEGLDHMMSVYGLTQEQVSKSVGKSRPYIANSLRLLKLPEEVRNMMSDGKLSGGHGRALLSFKSDKDRIRVAKQIEKEGLSVRDVEKLSGQENKKGKGRKGRPAERNADVLQVEAELKEHLGTKVNLRLGVKRGKIEIEYYSRDELERLIDLLRSV